MSVESGTAPPRVSVVMSVYNGLPLLRDAVASILTQTMPDFEFVIVNDGSTDGSREWLQEAAASDSRIRIIDQANTGLTRALITGVAAARAPLIARMDADDLSHPDRLARQAALLEAQPALSAVSSGLEYVSEDLTHIASTEGVYPVEAAPLLITLFNCVGGHGHMMFRHSAYQAAGGYDPAFRYAQDYDLWSRLLRVGPFGEAPGSLYQFRIGHDSISTAQSGKQLDLATQIATREYQALVGEGPDPATARLVLLLIGRRCPPDTDLSALLRADCHITRAYRRFLVNTPDTVTARKVRKSFATMWRDTRHISRGRPHYRATLVLLRLRWMQRRH